MGYNVHFQTDSSYKSVKYGQGTVYRSGCGPASLCNALDALGIAKVTVKTMCAYAVSVGARVSGGTDEATLLRHAAKKYGFSYKTTSKNAELLAHLKSGGVAILHGGNSYKLFSSGGHFVCAVAAKGSTITVLDSYWYSSKYTSSAIRRNYAHVVNKGVVQTSLTQCGKATIDRAPSYYLLSSSKQDAHPSEQEEPDMTYYKEFKDIPLYYQDAVKKLLDAGAIAGTGKGLELSEDLCRAFTILDKAGLLKL